MKRLLLLVGFVVFWKQWEYLGDMVLRVDETRLFEDLIVAKDFVSRHKKDERYTDMHIYRIGEEVQP